MDQTENNYEIFLKDNPQLNDFLFFGEAQNKESPRGAVLVACSYIEKLLRETIYNFLIESPDRKLLLDVSNAPIGTFSSRIKVAYCLGLISDEERNDCNILRKIRNEFAHNLRVSFNDKKLIDLCKKFYYSINEGIDGKEVDMTQQFKFGAGGLLLNLIHRPDQVKQVRIQKKNWQ